MLKSGFAVFQRAFDKAKPDSAKRLHDLGVHYGDSYRRTGAIADLETAIQRLQEALDATPHDHPARSRRLHHLGIQYRVKYRRTKVMTDLETAIQLYQEALDLTPDNGQLQASALYRLDRASRLSCLGAAYRDKHRETGAIGDLDVAIQRYQEAIDIMPDTYFDRASQLSNLGAGYRDRYKRTGALTDLKMAIQLFQKALGITPDNHADRARRLFNLGIGYQAMYRRTGVVADLTMAIQRSQEALDITPDDHPDWAKRVEHLGLVYGHKYRRTGQIKDLDTALQRFQEAFNATPDDDPDRAYRLYHLGIIYKDKYFRLGAMGDLETAILRSMEALDLTPGNHPDRAAQLYSLGSSYQARYRRTGAIADLEAATQRLREASTHYSSPAFDRLRPCKDLVTLNAEVGFWASAYEAASKAMSLVPLLTPRSLQNSDKQHWMTEVVGMASDAATAALMAEKPPYEAIRLLELGRGVITGSLNELRTDVSELQQSHPLLAKEFANHRDLLDGPKALTRQFDPFDQLATSMLLTRQIDQHYNAGKKLEQTIEAIRGLPSFDRFLLAPSEDELKVAAVSGPIVIINVSRYRCDALIIEKHKLRTVPLPYLNTGSIQSHAIVIANPQSLNMELLEWLWDTIAEPVLNALGFTESPSNDWPRMWWIPTGPLAKFPIHAAGYHSRGSDTVLDRVISSYGSSMKAIVQSHRDYAKAKEKRRVERVVLIGMQELIYAPQEISYIERLCESMQLRVRKPLPNRRDVLDALSDSEIFHFAGHGRSHPIDPSKSALLLGGDDDLTVASIFETNLLSRKPFLAYLSACGTGQSKHDGLVDESLHLIAACQLAGFKHVVGTLWEVNDKCCVDAAVMTYEWMRKRGISDESVSEGLHHASRSLRGRWVSENATRKNNRGREVPEEERPILDQTQSSQGKARNLRHVMLCDEEPLYWVPYVHFGV